MPLASLTTGDWLVIAGLLFQGLVVMIGGVLTLGKTQSRLDSALARQNEIQNQLREETGHREDAELEAKKERAALRSALQKIQVQLARLETQVRERDRDRDRDRDSRDGGDPRN